MIQSCFVETYNPVTGEKERKPALMQYTIYTGAHKQGKIKLDDRITRRLAAVKDVRSCIQLIFADTPPLRTSDV